MFFVFLFCQQFFLCLDTGKCFEGEEERKVLLKFQICMSLKGSNTLWIEKYTQSVRPWSWRIK